MIKKEEYGEFGASFLEGADRSDTLMKAPEIVGDDGYYGFSSAIWKYMKINVPGETGNLVEEVEVCKPAVYLIHLPLVSKSFCCCSYRQYPSN